MVSRGHNLNLVKICVALEWKTMMGSRQSFAHTTTAELLWHGQIYDRIRSLLKGKECSQDEFVNNDKVFTKWVFESSLHGELTYAYKHFISICSETPHLKLSGIKTLLYDRTNIMQCEKGTLTANVMCNSVCSLLATEYPESRGL